MEERRREPRTRSLLSGTILFNERKFSMDCAIRNISPAGALVALPPESPIPPSFELRIASNRKDHRATVVWRRSGMAGLSLAAAAAAPRVEKPPRIRPQGHRRAGPKVIDLGY